MILHLTNNLLDKAPAHLKDDSHTKFQEIAFAYAILSNPNRRKRYDRTGSTSESVDADGFSWSDFYSEQYRDIITVDAIKEFSNVYKGSIEERDDLLQAYTVHEGKWGKMYQVIMLSDPVEDEERFREIIEEAIKKGEVEEYAVFRNETKASKARRMKKAREEEKEAAQAAKRLGADKMLKGSNRDAPESSKKPKKQVPGHMDDLAAIIQARQASRAGFFDSLEAKYAPSGKKSAKHPGELDEEEFQRIQNGLGSRKSKGKGKGKGSKKEIDTEDEMEVNEEPAPKKKKKLSRGKKREPEPEVEEEDEDEEMDDGGNDQAEEAEEDEEEVEVEKPAPKKRTRKSATRQSKRAKTARA